MFFFRFDRQFRIIEDLGPLGCLGFLLIFVIFVGFLSSVTRVLTRVAAENRRMRPGQVWLNLIPVFHFVWMPVTVERVGESIRNELIARGQNRKRDEYGKTAGLTCLALLATGIVPLVSVVTYPFAVIYGVVYWVQLSAYARRLRDDPLADHPPADEGW